MSAIKHLEKLRSAAYFRDGGLPCIVREMRQAPSNAFVAMHDHEFSELVIVASGKINYIHAGQTDRLSRGDVFVIHPTFVRQRRKRFWRNRERHLERWRTRPRSAVQVIFRAH